MPEKQIICAWYSNKMSINRLSAPNSNICLIRLCAWSNFILLLSASCQSSPGPKHFLISSILFSFYPYSALMFHALLLKSKTQIQESICKKNTHFDWQMQVFSVHKTKLHIFLKLHIFQEELHGQNLKSFSFQYRHGNSWGQHGKRSRWNWAGQK